MCEWFHGDLNPLVKFFLLHIWWYIIMLIKYVKSSFSRGMEYTYRSRTPIGSWPWALLYTNFIHHIQNSRTLVGRLERDVWHSLLNGNIFQDIFSKSSRIMKLRGLLMHGKGGGIRPKNLKGSCFYLEGA